ncbi:MAG: ATP-binding protein [Deltaproteobacteria bacterium]|nr:ATP-binding protein [Deltaproteobacteria bacterium]
MLKDNPWISAPDTLDAWLHRRLPDAFVPRLQLASAAERWSQADQAHLVVGPRQCGKSTAIWSWLARRAKPVLYVDCELSPVREWCRSPPLFLADLERLAPAGTPVFFDEIQHLDEAALFLKGLVDRRPGMPLLVTGSSSFQLRSRTRESLAGRASRTRLFPFSLAEACGDAPLAPPAARAATIRDRFERHVIFGGYPRAWLADRPEQVLLDLVEAILSRDASDLGRIARPEAFRRLLRLAAGQAGNLVNFAEWSGLLGISRDTVAAYVEILESVHILVQLPPFAGGKRSELTGRPKIFLVDNGLRNHLTGDFRRLADRVDAGAVLENWAFGELWKALPAGATLHYWRSSSKAEVDFVVLTPGGPIGVEVKAHAMDRPRLERSSRSFLDAYRPPRFVVLNLELEHRETLDGVEVRWTTPEHLASAVLAPPPRPSRR